MTLVEFLEPFVTEERIAKFIEVLGFRTDYLTVVLENIYQSQNANAVLRTCDCFGVQDVHIIENDNTYRINPDVSLGSNKWLTVEHYNTKEFNTKDALTKLKARGYRIVATSPHAHDVPLPNFDVNKGKFALVFGTELTGISDTVREMADEFIRIPMFGFTESYNISVSAALCLHTLIPKIHQLDMNWKLDKERRDEVYEKWLRQSIRESDLAVKRYYEEHT